MEGDEYVYRVISHFSVTPDPAMCVENTEYVVCLPKCLSLYLVLVEVCVCMRLRLRV